MKITKAECEQLKERFKQDIQSAIKRSGMKDVEIAKKAGMTDSNFSYYKNNGAVFINPNVKKIAEVLDMDISYLPEKQETLGSFPQAVEKVNIKPTIIEIKEKQDGKFFVRWEGSYGETAEIMTADELAELKKRMSVPSCWEMDESAVLNVEPVSELDINEDTGLWVDGEKYTVKMVTDLKTKVEELEKALDNRDHRCNILQTSFDSLNEAYFKRDKEAIKLQVENEELQELVNNLTKKPEKNPLLNMTIEEGISQFRALKKLFKDEVLG